MDSLYRKSTAHDFGQPSSSMSTTTTPSSSSASAAPSFSPQLRIQVDTDALLSTPAHDPAEDTARPSNAHRHAQFLANPLPTDTDNDDDQQDNSPSDPSSSSMDMSVLKRPLTQSERDSLAQLDKLKYFLATAPSHWSTNSASSSSAPTAIDPHPALHRFLLPSQEYVSCVVWANLYHITGTDIVRALVFRFEAFGRPVRNIKKFEEGVFSDLRNLKPGIDACLEEPKSPFLDLLFKHQAIRTQKKQKVFYWFSVPHDRLFLDALERDLKREKMGQEPTTQIEAEPAASFTYDPSKGLFEQFCGAASTTADTEQDNDSAEPDKSSPSNDQVEPTSSSTASSSSTPGAKPSKGQNPYLAMFSLFEGSPLYKQRRKKSTRAASGLSMMFSDPSPSAAPPFDFDPNRRYGNPNRSSSYPTPSAEDMFHMQARGEYIKSESSPSAPFTGYEYPHPLPPSRQYGYADPAPYTRVSPPMETSYPVPHPVQPAAQSSAPYRYIRGGGKVYTCPLYTCGKIFKHPEQLSKHLNRHAMDNSVHTGGGASSTFEVSMGGVNGSTGDYATDIGEDVLLRDVEGDEDGVVAPVHGQPTPNYDSDYDVYSTARNYASGRDGQWGNAAATGSPSSSAYSDSGNIPSDMPSVPIRGSSQPASRPNGYPDYPNEYASQMRYAQPASVSSAINESTTSSPATASSISSSSLHHPSHVLHPSSSSPSSQQQNPRQSHSHHTHARSAPAFQSNFDHDQLGHASSSLSSALSHSGHPVPIPPHTAHPSQQQFSVTPIHPAHPQLMHGQLSTTGSPYSVHVPLSSSPPMKGMNLAYNGYASSMSSGSAASSVSGSPPMSNINTSPYAQQQQQLGHHTSQPVGSSHIGPVRRHRSMTPSLMKSDLEGTTASAMGLVGRPLTAQSVGSSAEFAMMQQQATAQHRDRSNAERGRGYHPYAGVYNSRSASVSTTASGRSSPASYPAGMSLANGSTSSLISSTASVGGAPSSAAGSMDGSAMQGMMRMNIDRDHSESTTPSASASSGVVRSASTGSSSLYGAQTMPPGSVQGMYRTESPLPYDVQTMHQPRPGTVGMFGMDVEAAMEQPGMSQYSQHGQQQQVPQSHHHQHSMHYSDAGMGVNGYYDQQRVPAMM